MINALISVCLWLGEDFIITYPICTLILRYLFSYFSVYIVVMLTYSYVFLMLAYMVSPPTLPFLGDLKVIILEHAASNL